MSEILKVEDCIVTAHGSEKEYIDPSVLTHRQCPCLHHVEMGKNITVELKIRSCDRKTGKTREIAIELQAANIVRSEQFYDDVVEKFPLTLILKEKD